MSENKRNDNEPPRLSDDELAGVSGGWSQSGEGWSLAGWDQSDEDALQADYAAHGAGMSLEDFMAAKGICGNELLCRENWLSAPRRKR